MCGLVGVAGAFLTEAAKKAFYDMLYLDVIRGEDSTGVAAVCGPFWKDPTVEVYKSLGSASDFFYEHGRTARDRSFTKGVPGIFIGHNRFATQGAVNVANAHPFDFPNVVGVHNGTVLKSSLSTFHGAKDFDVDSQIIYNHLSETQDLDYIWEKADGALALVWWDKVAQALKIIRNKERPLSICYSEDDKLVMWSSEYWMLAVAAQRQGIKLKDPVAMKPDRLFTFGKNADGTMFHTERDLPPFVAPPVKVWGQGYRNYYDDWLDDGPVDKAPKSHIVGPRKDEMIVVREYHDITTSPSAVGFTTKGEEVRVQVPLGMQREVKNKITGRAQSGYYICKHLYRNVGAQGGFWCHWSDLQFYTLKKPSTIINLPNDGFKVEYAKAPEGGREKALAPWFETNTFMTQDMYTNKVVCGCTNCTKTPNWGDREALFWISKDNFYCYDCQSLPLVQDFILEAINKQSKGAA